MKLKRMLAMMLVAATLCSFAVVLPASAVSATSGFTDITDQATADAAEILRLLGVVEGTGGGAFNPGGTLTRAQFCKMAIEIRGEGAKAEAQMNRTVFRDVKGGHWARGYVNYASSIVIGGEGPTAERLIMGRGDGYFYPEVPITYSEAVTMSMRLLGYAAANVGGGIWPNNYLSTAKSIGLLEGLSAGPDDSITRAQAAILFQNLLYTNVYQTDKPFLTTMGGSITGEAIILSLDATADDKTTGAIKVTDGTTTTVYKTDHVPFDATLEGMRAKLVLDKDQKVLAIQISEGGTRRTVSIVEAEATYLTTSGGEKLNIALDTTVYKDGEATTYAKLYMGLKAGDQMTFYYSAAGNLEYTFIPKADAVETAMVAKTITSGNPFAALIGNDTGYRILKNGVSATASDIRQYDVATYDKATKTLNVSDLRLTGVYENALPSPKTPLTVTVLGASFPVLSSGMDDLASFKIGDTITLLLTADGQVAGAVSASTARSTVVGTVVDIRETHATVESLTLMDTAGKPVRFAGDVNYSKYSADKMKGQLVTVSSSRVNQISLTRLTDSGAKGVLDVNARTLGDNPLADNVYLYERVGNGAPVSIKWSQLTRATVPASNVSYVGKDYAGRVNILVLDDVTGDRYSYGFAKPGQISDFFNNEKYYNSTIAVKTAEDADGISGALVSGASIKEDMAIGIAASLETVSSHNRLASWVELKSISNVSRSAFDVTRTTSEEDSLTPIGTVTTPEMVIPVAGNVTCYNATTKKWFNSLDEARAYSDSLTIYYDRAPEEGGKVRLVVAK